MHVMLIVTYAGNYDIVMSSCGNVLCLSWRSNAAYIVGLVRLGSNIMCVMLVMYIIIIIYMYSQKHT